MTMTDFQKAPWKNSHDTYRASIFSMSPAPEYASSEVLVASLYRTIGLDGITEGSVPQAGRDLDKRIQKHRDRSLSSPDGAVVDADVWQSVLHGVLESPKLPNQSTKRFLQVTPLVPSVGLFSGSARLSANSWPAGSLVRRMVCIGSKDLESAEVLWGELFEALSVDGRDDVFARWLQQEMEAWSPIPRDWRLVRIPPGEGATLAPADFQRVQFLPARRFTKDLRAIIQAKESMTRRQWTSLLEAVLRLAVVSHVVWLCDVQARMWACVLESLGGSGPADQQEVAARIFPDSPQYMSYGAKALPGIKDRASGYLQARLGINSVLWGLEGVGAGYEGKLDSSTGIAELCRHVRHHAGALAAARTTESFAETRERENRALLCTKGIGSNLLEFARHALGQRQTAAQLLRGYDQGYVLRKKGASPSSPWIVALGPVSVLALVHCALAGMGGPRSIRRLGQHLAAYGIVVDRHDIGQSDLGHQLRMLGLILDSPDAESGMLLLPPFPATARTPGREIAS